MTPLIAIVGAGPSGLCLGRLLELANINYIIFERQEAETWATGGQGGTLDIRAGSGQFALDEAGLLDQFKAVARADASNTFADATGKVYFSVGGDASDGNGGRDRPEIDRRDLQALLSKSIPANKIRWGYRLQCVNRDTNGSMSVHFADGGKESGFRLVVGADGAWSKVRPLIHSAKPQYSGLYCFATSIKPENPFHASASLLAGTGNYMAYGMGKQFITMKLGDGSYHTSVGLRLPENWKSEHPSLREDPLALRQWLLDEHFALWAEQLRELIRNTEGDILDWPLYSMPTESLSWETVPGVTLIGDAAHVSTPFIGEGVNCALNDSVELAQQIVKHGLDDLDGAVANYEKSMFPRAINLIEQSAKSGELLFAADSPRGWLKQFAGIDCPA